MILLIYYYFRPGQSRFREKWLKDIIENKVMMMQMKVQEQMVEVETHQDNQVILTINKHL